jgi:hypothetical protein
MLNGVGHHLKCILQGRGSGRILSAQLIPVEIIIGHFLNRTGADWLCKQVLPSQLIPKEKRARSLLLQHLTGVGV